ncbi:MAG TPA: lysophospholipid acyltransferase family protein [Candidatus Saccharimonadales bacterium]|nr:lysophospholipid acyltransferase family protein [Candidatus Saccharimonadales bacterium]
MTDLGYSFASFLVRTLPPRATDALADVFSDAYVLTHPGRARAVGRTLAWIWKDARREGAPPRARETYRAFARALRDFLAHEPGDRDPRVRLSGRARESLETARRSGRGAVLVSGHFGPWERALQWLAEERGGVEALAARHRLAAVDRFFIARRARGGVRTLCATRPVASALQSLKAGGWIAALADRPRRSEERRGIVPLDPGPLLLARRAGALVLPGVASFAPDGGMEIDFHPPFTVAPGRDGVDLDQARLVVQRFFDAHVRNHPTQWFAWEA